MSGIKNRVRVYQIARQLLPLLLYTLFVITPTKAQGQSQHVTARLQALGCVDADEKPECNMYMRGFLDTVRFVMHSGESSKTICPDTDPVELVPEFDEAAQKYPETDANAVLFQILKEQHMCSQKEAGTYYSTPAGKLFDLCRSSDVGFRLCMQYQRGFLNAIFFMSEETKIPVLCGDLGIVDSTIQIADGEVEKDFHLRQQPAVSVMLGTLQNRLPCPKENK